MQKVASKYLINYQVNLKENENTQITYVGKELTFAIRAVLRTIGLIGGNLVEAHTYLTDLKHKFL